MKEIEEGGQKLDELMDKKQLMSNIVPPSHNSKVVKVLKGGQKWMDNYFCVILIFFIYILIQIKVKIYINQKYEILLIKYIRWSFYFCL